MSISPRQSFAVALSRTRRQHGFSQLGLAILSGVSQRHISFLETDRNRPSREMVLRVAAAMELRLPERNQLLLAAGFAPQFGEHHWSDPELEGVRRVVDMALASHEPFPALAVDRAWRPIAANGGALRLFGRMLGEQGAEAPLAPNSCLLRAAVASSTFRKAVANWTDVVRHMERLVRDELPRLPQGSARDEILRTLAILDHSQTERSGHEHPPPGGTLIMQVRMPDLEVDLVSTIARFGAPHDAGAEDVRIEYFFPVDGPSEAALRSLAMTNPLQTESGRVHIP